MPTASAAGDRPADPREIDRSGAHAQAVSAPTEATRAAVSALACRESAHPAFAVRTRRAGDPSGSRPLVTALRPHSADQEAVAVAAAALRLLLPQSLSTRALLVLLVAAAVALEVAGAAAAYKAASKWRRKASRARREARRLANKSPAAPKPPAYSGALIEDKRLRDEYYMTPDENAEWKVVRIEDFSYLPIPEDWDASLQALQLRIGVQFKDARHLKCALVHHGVLSGVHLPGEVALHRLSNRCMEFLGDSVLAMAAAAYVFQAQPTHQEGKLTRAKDMLVNNQTLSRICVEDLRMDELVIVDPYLSVRRKSAGNTMQLKGRVTIDAGAVEALIAAIYLDQGLECALRFINCHVLPHAIRYAAREVVWDPALELQTLLQAHGMGHPVFEKIPTQTQTGKEDRDVALIVQGQRILTATDSSYKAARRQVADDGYQHYMKLLGPLPPT